MRILAALQIADDQRRLGGSADVKSGG